MIGYLRNRKKELMIITLILLIITVIIYFVYNINFKFNDVIYNSKNNLSSTNLIKIKGKKVKHIKMPSAVKAVYMSACYASGKHTRDKLIKLIKNTDLNSIVIDVKDFSGTISIPVSSEILKDGTGGNGCKIRDAMDLIKELHNNNIYTIGRITVFQDPLYTKLHKDLAVHKASNKNALWKDYKGLSFVDVGSKEYWDYVVALSREAFDKVGFDEINFDYVRYPSDGPMNDIYFSNSGGLSKDVNMSDNLEKFFIYLNTELKRKNHYGDIPNLSVDLFGMTTTNYDDLTIGQVLEKTLPYFDVISTMVYPSHYPRGFIGLNNPNNNVYTVVNYSMKRAVERVKGTITKIHSYKYKEIKTKDTSKIVKYKKPIYSTKKLRPWLQDFDYGGNYGVKEVNNQIKASLDAGVTGGYMIWSPSNIYTPGVSY